LAQPEEAMVRTECRHLGEDVLFVVLDLPERYHGAAGSIGLEPVEGGLARQLPATGMHLERAYHNFSRLVEDVILTEAGERPNRWDAALETFLRTVDGQDIAWYLVGSASLAVRGIGLVPGDIDLAADAEGAHRLGELLADALIEPVIPVTDWICDWWGRAFLGARVEWVGAVHPSVDVPLPADYGPVAASRLETVHWRGYALRVPPLDLVLGVSERRGLTQRAALIRQAMAEQGR
jgi:hypothetical protein